MKIRPFTWLLAIDILTILLILSIALIPSSIVRFILGLPLFLFFPGYALLQAVFGGKQEMGILERVGISCVMSIAIVALIGFALNYTTWGIALEPALYAVVVFTLLASVIAFIRLIGSTGSMKRSIEPDDNRSVWKLSGSNKLRYGFLAVTMVIAIVALGYTTVVFAPGKTFVEFYVLGPDGMAQDYPSGFVIDNGRVSRVLYDDGTETAGQWGEVLLGIINHGRTTVTYSVEVIVDGRQVDVMYEEAIVSKLSGIELGPGDKWEDRIGFAPWHTGDDQRVEFLLFVTDSAAEEESLSLWIDVRDAVTGTP